MFSSTQSVVLFSLLLSVIVESKSLRFERKANETAAPINYSCERQTFKKVCADTQRPTQFVLRWYLMNGKCCSYPYGYCHGDEVSQQNSIRTKEDCEAICIRGEKPTGSPQNVSKEPLNSTANPITNGPIGTTISSDPAVTNKPTEVATTHQEVKASSASVTEPAASTISTSTKLY